MAERQLPEGLLEGARAVVLFDGQCRLCSGAVRFVYRLDPRGHFRFASLDSPAGRRLLASCGLDPEAAESVVLIERRGCSVRSTAVLRISAGLRFPWPLAAALLVVPRRWRDRLYDMVARRRGRWFGRTDRCFVPDGGLAERFLDDGG